MKLFLDYHLNNKLNTYLAFASLILLVASCATHKVQYGKNVTANNTENATDTIKIAQTIYLVGDAGNADEEKAQQTLELLHQRLKKSGKNATLLFLGDNIYPKGFPSNNNATEKALAETKLTNQLQLTKGFRGKTIFIPGNHDWYSGIKGLELQAEFVSKYLNNKKAFLPRKSCPIEDVKIDSTTALVTIDSEWFLEDWDNHPTINENCDIKTREDFFDQLENILKKNQEKTVVVAIHHPILSNGSHGGQYSLEKQLFPFEKKIPLPIIGSFINLLRKTSGINPQDLQNKQYTIYAKRIKTLLQGQKNVIVVSGHDHNLQYINSENIKQIISGAGSKSEAARAINPNDFSYGGNGYAMLVLFKSGDAKVSFFGNTNNKEKLLFEHEIIKAKEFNWAPAGSNTFQKTTTTSIYTTDMTKKSLFHKFLFGNHYRKYYSLPINAKTATIDTLMGGLKPIREGGGHQSISLRMSDPKGREYVMRGMKKSATAFLQSVAFKDQYVVNDFEKTYAENFLLDFYTTSHPYAPFVIGSMADQLGLPHTNPVLYYIPKQDGLKEFNSNFGDALYMVEERPADNHLDAKNFGHPSDIISTDDMMKNLHKDEKYEVDEKEYIKARLFDMLIGDWDRHSDQWRWAEHKKGDKIIYRPIPRDRDQAFTKYDGTLLSILMNIPALRHMRTFKNKIDNVKWLNREPYPLDLAFLKTAEEKDWLAQAQFIQDNLSDTDIDNAFKNMPKEVQDETVADIKQKLKNRKKELQKYASEYFGVLSHTIMIAGTDKKDKFVIHHNAKKSLEIQVFRIKKEGDELVYTKNVTDAKTKNLWIYGLDDNDVFEVVGKEKSRIKIRLIGGQNNDTYAIENGRKVIVYDFKSKENTYNLDSKTQTQLTDDYEVNLYNYQKPKYNVVSGLPNIGFNPDDGIKVGINLNYTVNNFKQNPYTQRHVLNGFYYFATGGLEFNYAAHFPGLLGKWIIDVESQYTTPNFAMNYFGYGNETQNNDDEFGMDYNRVRIQKFNIAAAIRHVGRYGSEFSIQPLLQQMRVEETKDRYIDLPNIINPTVFESQLYGGAKVKYGFKNADFASKPTLGIGFMMSATWLVNLENTKQNFPTLESLLSFTHKIDHNGKLVLATAFKGKTVLNNNYEFYHGASLGGDTNLRGYRNERFLGSSYFSQSSDLRFSIGKIQRTIAPLTYGVLGGFDYGRIWIDGDNSKKWHQDFGGGLWLNAINVLTARISYFKAPEEVGRVIFAAAFSF
ncbi:metallophosphoesterase [Flavobacterium sp. Fl-77]|uniref:Metallophosphoesterase n=1 Tax=Flavobacterium flavipigmentatum TaxID=2893884 RepID=A0AAJ2VYP3_9FLAO|nr:MULTISPECIES: metallophosphoesterase [unclassified Flavobacterium]MDX6183361.1 metallophosphoesterase [Flavobacterium sp. Fl-33]MDX6186645.1 metallophosphoesterase [Flavobacterium sp. Fl-77]UFH38587.1 metallophosphoesterase [Flavobacterium sp. F-70]